MQGGKKQPTESVDEQRKRAQNLSGKSSSWKWISILRVVLVFASMFAVFTISYWVTVYFYHRIGYRPGQYKIQMTIVGVAVILFLMTGLTIGGITAPKQRAFWQSLIGAIRQMATGNFNIHLDIGKLNGPGEFRQLVHSINDMAQELSQLEQMRQEFVANVSHEIQSPLTAILGFVAALKNEALTREDRLHYLGIIETEGKRMSRLSENLLKLTSLESGTHPFHPELFRIDRQIRDVVLSLDPLFTKKELQIELSLQNMNIRADKDLLSQVFINLLANAIKFTPCSGTIYISLFAEDEWVVIRFRDTGTGISQEDLQHIFDRFFKADKSHQRRETGSGLGLTIVKKIIDLHSGQIQADSQIGMGTTFTIRLPNRQG